VTESLPLFVYGTLLSGEARAGMLGELRRQPAHIRGQLYHLPAGYPAVVLGGDSRVHGQIVDAPGDRLLAMLDVYEGVADGLYRREIVGATLGLRTERAWVYVTDAARVTQGRHLTQGRWRSVGRR
jgi:gamma-glutamylcyclotransferase (GGCT)/AIG2-like uncharacterized protein YtfP